MDATFDAKIEGKPDPRPEDDTNGWGGLGLAVITVVAIVWMLSDLASGPEPVAKLTLPTPIPTEALRSSKSAANAPAPKVETVDSSLVPAPTQRVIEEPAPQAAPAPAATVTQATAPVAPVTRAPARQAARAPAAQTAAASAAQPARAPQRVAAPPRAQVQAPKPIDDARIRSQVVQRLEANRSISGRISVESRGAIVHLSGFTYTPTQARLAERAARSVHGVRGVRNEIRSRVGGTY